jgi:alpha-beta hydrolase superfamily lysophospholipase
MSLVQRGLLATTLPLVPHVAVGNGLNPAWISRDPAVVAAYKDDPLVHNRITPMLAKMLADTGAAVMAHAARWPVPTLLMWAGADRCVAPAGSASFAAAARKSGDGSGVEAELFEPLFHEIFNEPEQDQVFDRLKSWLAARF